MLLSYSNLADELHSIYGLILLYSVTILRDRETRESKGVAWIQFAEYCLSFYNYVRRESAEKAIENLNGSKVDVIEDLSFHGLEVHIKSRMGKR